MEKDCKHKWVKLIAKRDGKLITTALWTCLECGSLRVGVHTIKMSKDRLDMGNKPIQNASIVTATELHGTVYYSDVHFEETTCPICGKRFKKHDKIALLTRKAGKKGISLWPAHLNCNKK